MNMTAKWGGVCASCGSRYEKDEQIFWDGKAHHASCAPEYASPPPAAQLTNTIGGAALRAFPGQRIDRVDGRTVYFWDGTKVTLVKSPITDKWEWAE